MLAAKWRSYYLRREKRVGVGGIYDSWYTYTFAGVTYYVCIPEQAVGWFILGLGFRVVATELWLIARAC